MGPDGLQGLLLSQRVRSLPGSSSLTGSYITYKGPYNVYSTYVSPLSPPTPSFTTPLTWEPFPLAATGLRGNGPKSRQDRAVRLSYHRATRQCPGVKTGSSCQTLLPQGYEAMARSQDRTNLSDSPTTGLQGNGMESRQDQAVRLSYHRTTRQWHGVKTGSSCQTPLPPGYEVMARSQTRIKLSDSPTSSCMWE